MSIKKMTHCDYNKINDLGSFYCFRIQRSNVKMRTSLLIKHGAHFVSKIFIHSSRKNMGDIEYLGTEERVRLNKMYIQIGDKKIYFLFCGGSFFCEISDLVTLKTFIYKNIVLKYRNELPKVTRTPREILDVFIDNTKNLYINKSTYEEFIDTVRPFIATYGKRKDFDLNMCLSVIFRGDPGDGKTYNGKYLARWAAHLLNLKYIEEEHTVFDKAAKLCEDFAALIDDMNAAHFRRGENGVGSICQNILSEMDRPNCNRLFILTTNEEVSKENMDAAFFRPGRVQSIITFKKPDEELKERIVDDIFAKLSSNNITVDKDFSCGIKMFALDDDHLSLAEIMRLRTLITTDLIVEQKLNTPQSYIQKSKAFKIEVHNDDNT